MPVGKTALTLLALCCAYGCYAHHRHPGDAEPDAGRDAAGMDASTDADLVADALVDAPADVPLDAPVDAGCDIVTLKPVPITAPVDIVWAIDSSRSMQDERDRLQATINDFARRVRARVDDLRVVVITAENIVPPPLGTDALRYLFVRRDISSNEVMAVLLDSQPMYASFLRDNALLHLVLVTDDDSAVTAGDFLARADLVFNKPYTVHAIASPDVNGAPCRTVVPSPLCLQTGIQAVCGAANIGVQYYQAAERTGGLSINVCLDDWTRVVGPLSDAVVGSEPVPCRSSLPLRTDGSAVTLSEATFRVSGLETRSLRDVGTQAQCASTNLGFYRELRGAEAVDTFTLCPATCTEVQASEGEIELRVDCGR